MKKKLSWAVLFAVPMLFTGLLFAAEGGAAVETAKNIASIPYFVWATAAIAVGFAFTTAICGVGQALAVKSGLEGIARQPEASDKIQITMLLGLAFIESLALFALFINIILLFANPFIKYLQ